MRKSFAQSLATSAGLLLLTSGAAFAQGNSDNVRTLNNRVLQFHGAIQRAANAAEAAQIRSQAAPVITSRAAALTALIREDSNAALGLAFSQDLRNDLAAKFPEVANSLEQHGTWSGTSDHLIFDDPERRFRRFQVSVKSGNEILEIYSAGEPHCVSGNTLSSTGIRINNVVAAGSTNVTASGTAGAGCSTLGPQSTAVILVQFPSYPLPSTVTSAGVSDIFFADAGKSVNTYWKEASYNQASATGQVFGPYTLSTDYTCDQYSAMRTAAIAAADPYVNFTQFNRIFIVFPSGAGCSWAGLGTLGCSTLSSADGSFQASTSWLLASYMGSVDNGVKLATHEGGHNLTLHHSSSRDFGSEAVGPLGMMGTFSEYGDPHSTMGSWNFGHYPAPHKVLMGWLPSSNVTTVESPGPRTVLPFENSVPGGVQALKIRRGTGGNSWLWVEYRQPIGLYDSTLNTQVHSGALVHMEDSTTGTHTHLVDFTTGTSSFSDSALTGAWTDPYTNLNLAVTGANASGLSVDVGYRALTCDLRVQPTVTISPANPSVMAGSSYSFSVSVTNHDHLGCGSSTFALSSTAPDWTTSFSSSSLTLTPGQTLSVTMTKFVPVGYTPGTYALNALATDANHSGVGSNNITVIASTCTNLAPTVTISPSTVTASRGASQAFSLSVRNNEASPCTARTFNLSSALPTGWTSTLSANSLTLAPGATGSATITKTVPVDAAFSSFTVSGTASDPLNTVTANATLTVAQPITATLAVTPTVVSARSNVTFTATVRKSDGTPASGASVTFRATRTGGGTSTGTATTNASGVATWTYRAQQRGTYTGSATATLNGVSATTNSVTFTAQ